MNKTEFIQLIDSPELLGTKQVSELKQILANFPYFIHARVLTTKALYNEKHYEYEKYLKQTALSVPDRDVLYHYIHDLAPHWLTSNKAETNKPEVQIAATDSGVKIPEPVIEEPTIPLVSLVDDNAVITIEEPVGIIAEDLIEVNTATPIVELETTTLKVDEEVKLSEDELKADLVISAFLEESLIIKEESTSLVESGDANGIVETTHQEITFETTTNSEEEIDQERNETDETELTFVEWLQQQNSPHIQTSAPKVDKVIPEKITNNINYEQVTPVTKPQKVEQPIIKPIASPNLPEVTKADIDEAVANSNVNNFHTILDRFIKENPSISRPKAEFFNPVNMARQSVEEDDDLVTETLANLLYKQGNYKKAIKAYEKLCLLYPSKMSYFASLIKKIKTEQKD